MLLRLRWVMIIGPATFCFAMAQQENWPVIQPDQARLVLTLGNLGQPTLGVQAFPERGIVLTLTERGSLQQWTAAQLYGVHVSETNPAWYLDIPSQLTAAKPCPDYQVILGAIDGKLYIVRLSEGKILGSSEGHPSPIRALSNCGSPWIASGGEDGQVVVWDWTSLKPRAKWAAHRDWISALALDERAKQLASAGYDGTICLWHLENGQKLREFPLYPAQKSPPSDAVVTPPIVVCLAFSPDGKLLAGGSLDGNIRLWDVTSGGLLHILTGHSSQVTSLVFHPAGQILVTASRDRTIRLWNVVNGQLLRVLDGHQSWVMALALVERGTRLVSASMDGTLRIWDLRAPPK
ncbi:MAG: WD40 repeat domain-containing protein [Gemmatales bacterium]|nr:WD40 repeat domain-containing protein [Gemmatales bacterium]MDW7993489.1 WD40 repeat domain-containing protein [Gemmatales bacterium]